MELFKTEFELEDLKYANKVYDLINSGDDIDDNIYTHLYNVTFLYETNTTMSTNPYAVDNLEVLIEKEIREKLGQMGEIDIDKNKIIDILSIDENIITIKINNMKTILKYIRLLEELNINDGDNIITLNILGIKTISFVAKSEKELDYIENELFQKLQKIIDLDSHNVPDGHDDHAVPDALDGQDEFDFD